MNLRKIYKLQKDLDNKFEKAFNLKSQELVERRILALIVELSELANEISFFKYWKKNINKNINAIYEEFVDCLHFFSSLAIHFKLKDQLEILIIDKDPTKQFLEIYKNIIEFQKSYDLCALEKAFCLFLGIQKMIDLDEKDIEKIYINKKNINEQRIKNDY